MADQWVVEVKNQRTGKASYVTKDEGLWHDINGAKKFRKQETAEKTAGRWRLVPTPSTVRVIKISG